MLGIFDESSKYRALRRLQDCHPGARRGPWVGFGLGFAGLMDPGLRRDDSFAINEGLGVTTAFATTTPVTPVKTGVHGSA
jgi:hypothetical protein